uniref:Uncharacterized protein n=1 Tax=Glossina pallidipes TaxID=7398 RepID=A0A1A9ZPL3_GLOPL
MHSYSWLGTSIPTHTRILLPSNQVILNKSYRSQQLQISIDKIVTGIRLSKRPLPALIIQAEEMIAFMSHNNNDFKPKELQIMCYEHFCNEKITSFMSRFRLTFSFLISSNSISSTETFCACLSTPGLSKTSQVRVGLGLPPSLTQAKFSSEFSLTGTNILPASKRLESMSK